MKKILLSLFTFLLFTFHLYAQPSFIKDSLDSYIKQGIKDWQIPGLAIAIIKDGKIVVMKGYGVKDLESNAPVDENTLFMIASNSKLFTGTALAQLEYNKKLSLNDKITKYFPDYKAYDKNTTELVTIRDMLSHHLGTKTFQADFTFWNSVLSRKEIINKMQYMKPVGLFRQDYGYCNSCFLTAGEIIPIVSGKPWEVYVYDSIITPLGMSRTQTLGYGMEQMTNAAKPYTTNFTGNINLLPYDKIDNLAPAGSIVSCVKDLSKWLMMQLDSGRFEGKRIMPWPVLARTRAGGTLLSTRKNGTTHFMAYGLGVLINDYYGRQVYSHTGGADGFVTNTCFIPEEKLAITILTNNDNQDFFELLRMQIIDAYVNAPYINKSLQALPEHKEELKDITKKLTGWKARLKNNAPDLPLTAYAGNYENQLYGSITVTSKGKDLQIKFNGHNNLTATMQYMDNGEWLTTYSSLAFGIYATKFNIEGGVVKGIDIKVADFIEYDAYPFIKK